MRPDRHFVLAQRETVERVASCIDSMMPMTVPVDSGHQILWGETGITFTALRNAIANIAGWPFANRIMQYGQNHRYSKIRSAGIALKGYLDSSDDLIPLWTRHARNVAKDRMVQLCWIADQAGHGRGYGMQEKPVRGPIYGSSIVKRVLERAHDPLSLRTMLEKRSASSKEAYELTLGTYPEFIDARLTMTMNYVRANLRVYRSGDDGWKMRYSGNVIEALMTIPESVASGLQGRMIDDVIEWDMLAGAGIVITSASYLPNRGGMLRLGVSDPADIQIIEIDKG